MTDPGFDADDALADAVMRASAPVLDSPPVEHDFDFVAPPNTGPVRDPAPAESTDGPADTPKTEPPVREFDPKWRLPFEGLLYVGHLDDTVTLFGHRFVLVTPSSTERTQIGLVIKDFNDTVSFEFAYTCAYVAAFLVSVDGRDLPMPISNDPKDIALRQRFDWVRENLKKQVIDALYNACLVLDDEVGGVLTAMGKASG